MVARANFNLGNEIRERNKQNEVKQNLTHTHIAIDTILPRLLLLLLGRVEFARTVCIVCLSEPND